MLWNYHVVLFRAKYLDTALVESDSKWKEDELDQRGTIATSNPSLIVKVFASLDLSLNALGNIEERVALVIVKDTTNPYFAWHERAINVDSDRAKRKSRPRHIVMDMSRQWRNSL